MPENEAAATTGEAGSHQQGSAPGNTNPKNTGGSVDTVQNQNGGGLPAGARREFFTLREKVREKNTEVEQLRAELESLKAQGTVGRGNRKVDPLEDPDAFASAIEDRVSKAVEERMGSILRQRSVEATAVQAEKWLLTRNHLQEDAKAGDEIAQIIQSDYAHVAQSDPRAAARSAYLDWCESKGVAPDLSKEPGIRPPTGHKPSQASGGSSDRVWTSSDVSAAIRNAKTPEEKARINQEVVKAYHEGRYRGQAIKLR